MIDYQTFLPLMRQTPATARDGLLIHVHQMAHQRHALLLPRQLAYYRKAAPEEGFSSFVCGVSGDNMLPAVNFCQDMRAWRIQLQRAGIEIPAGSSFSGHAHADYLKFALKAGYPVSLQPVIRNAMQDEIIRGIGSPTELKHHFLKVRRIDKKAEQMQSWSPYAMTRLSEDYIDDDGVRHVPRSVRFFIQQELQGEHIRLICAGGALQCALRQEQGSGGAGSRIVEAMHPDFERLVRDIFKAMQGMEHLRIEVVVVDPSRPATKGNYYVTDISEQLRLHELAEVDPVRVNEILHIIAPPGAENAPGSDGEMLVSGISSVEELETDLASLAKKYAFNGRVLAADPVTGKVRIAADGAYWRIAAACWSYANGLGVGQAPTSVTQQL